MTTKDIRKGGKDDSGIRSDKTAGVYLAYVNDIEVKFSDPVQDGKQILKEAGLLPAIDHVLIHLVCHGTLSVGLDESVDLSQMDVDSFRAFKSDRIFLFTIDGRGYEWGAAEITEPELRLITGIDEDENLVQIREEKEILLAAADVVNLAGSGTEHLRISKCLITVYLDNVEKRIPAGTYQTEELISTLGVETGYLLNVLNEKGDLIPLEPDQKLDIKDGMKFYSQVPCGGSS